MRYPNVFAALLITTALLAHAEDKPTEDANLLDTIEVTGTHIRGVDLETQRSIQILTREDLDRTGLTSVGDVLQTLIVANGPALNRNINNASNSGEVRIDLRGFGANRTLVLLNGQRWETGLEGAVDVSTIPLSMVERVEVLKDGASAIYGSDAIAGVVNIITRRKFDGAELELSAGESSYGDAAEHNVHALFGRSGDGWNFDVGVESGRNDPVYSRNRAISNTPTPGLPLSATGGPFDLFWEPSLSPICNCVYTLTSGRPGTSPDDFRPLNPATDFGFNFQDYTYLQTPQERRAVFAQGRYEFTPTLALSVEALYDRRESAQRLAPPNLIFDSIDLLGPQAYNISADNVYNPFGEDIPLGYTRLIAMGQRDYHETVDLKRLHIGLDGLADVAGRDLHWAVDVTRVRSVENLDYGPNPLHSRVALAVGPSFFDANGVAHCGTPDAVIAACVPLNLFGGPDAITPDMIANLGTFLHDNISGQVTDLDARVDGELIQLPAGEMHFALGAERRILSGANRPDPLEVSGDANSSNSGFRQDATIGSNAVNEAYAELSVPLLADKTFARNLDLIAATRYSRYTAFGSTTNSQLGARWKPVDDLLFRANYAQGFRAPSLFDLFQGKSDSEDFPFDPCAPDNGQPPDPAVAAHCRALGVPDGVSQPERPVTITQGSNPQLGPETSRSYSFGMAWSPQWIPNLDLTLDWYDIQLRNAIDTHDDNYYLNNCYVVGDPVACTHITRFPDGTLQHVFAQEYNLPGGEEVEGIDLGLGYKFENRLGKWGLRWDVANIFYSGEVGQPKRNAVLPDGSIAGGNQVGTLGVWRWRSVATLDFTRGTWNASVTSRFFSAVTESCQQVVDVAYTVGDLSLLNLCSDPNRVVDGNPAPANHVGSVLYFDFALGWEAAWHGHFTIGIRNAFDRGPPPLRSEGGGDITFDPAYDLPGRFYYVSYHQKF
jgi:iron complex outermembrane receptor protein